MTPTDPMSGPFVFVDVDTQRDFLDPGGTLYLPGSGGIRPNLRRLTELARERWIPVVATACAHTLDEEDPEPFPPHCLVGTEGQRRIDETAWEKAGAVVLSPTDGDLDQERPAHLTIEKTRYDVFSRPATARVFDRYERELGRPLFVVYGVATDYCVRCAVEGLLKHGHRVALVADAIWAVDPSREADVLTDLTGRGALLTTTDVVATRWSG